MQRTTCLQLFHFLTSFCIAIALKNGSTPLRVTAIEYAPFNYQKFGQHIGIEIEMLKVIANILNLDLIYEWHPKQTFSENKNHLYTRLIDGYVLKPMRTPENS